MDQGGLKRSGNRDDGLTFRPTGELDGGGGIGGGAGGGGGGGQLHSAMHLPAPRETPNGTTPGGRSVVGEDKAMGIQKQQQQPPHQQEQHNIDVFNMEGNLSFLEQSIADLDRMSTSHVISTSSSSILGNLPLPNLFSMQHIKQEVDFGLEKDLATYCGPLGQVGLGSQLDSGDGSPLIEDSQIWNDLELSSSLPDISDFELEGEVVKEEKDMAEEESFVRLCTPGVVKQEKLDAGEHCQASCLQSRRGPLQGAGGVTTNTSAASPTARGGARGPAFDYSGAGATSSSAGVLQDQKPFDMYSNLPLVGAGWGRGNGYGEMSSVMGRSSDGLSSSAAGLAFPLGFPR